MKKLNLERIENDVVYYSSANSSYVYNATARELISKGLVSLFERGSKDKIYAMDSMTKLDIKWYGFLTALYMATLLIAIPMSPQMVSIFGTFQPAGILIFPITFIVLDTINATLRYEYAKTTTLLGAGLCALASALIALTFQVFDIQGSYREVFSPLIKLYLINSICIISADQANNMIFRKMTKTLHKAPIWSRSIVSSIVGQALYTVIWIGIFFNTSTSFELISKIIDNYFFKIGYGIALIPLIYLLVGTYNTLKKRYK